MMKNLVTLLVLIASHTLYSQEIVVYNVDSIRSEIQEGIIIPEHEMLLTLTPENLTLSGYDMHMKPNETTVFRLAKELGEGMKAEGVTVYTSWLYLNNPTPDATMLIKEFSDHTILTIKTDAFISTYYCKKQK